MTVTKSSQNNLTSPNGNSLAVFVDIADNTLKLKDINGNVEDFTIYLPPTPLGDGILQLQNGAPLDSTLRSVTDQKNTASPLKLSTNSAQSESPVRISTDDASEMYLDCEDGSQNNRFNITRNTASQQVNLNFASNPVGSTTTVGAIRTYVDGTNLSEVVEFREDGNVKVGGILSVGNYANSTGFGQKIRIIGQGDASLGIYRNQASASAAKLEFMKSRGTYDSPLIVNANDLIGNVGYFGYNGTSYSAAASISSAALSTSATGVEGDVRFILYNNTGSNFNPMRMTKEGVGIGNALDYIPSAILQVRGNGSTSATTSLLVQNSASNNTLQVLDDASVIINGNNTSTTTLFRANNSSGNYAIKTLNNYRTDFGYFSSGNTGTFLDTDVSSAFRAGLPSISPSWYAGYFSCASGDVRVGQATNGTNSNPSAILQCNTTTQGFLLPRMTTVQRDAIVSPATGLQVFNTTLGTVDVYDGTGWDRFGSQTLIRGAGSTSATTSLLVQNSAGSTALQVRDDASVSILGNFSNWSCQYNASGVSTPLNFSAQFGANSTNNSAIRFGFNFRESGGFWLPDYFQNILYDNTSGSVVTGFEWYTHQTQSGSATSQLALSLRGKTLSVGTNTPSASAVLQADSTTQGFLPPRMTTAQKVTLAATAVAGLIIYDTNLNKLCVYTGAGWETITSV
jgi:hypothetical protein